MWGRLPIRTTRGNYSLNPLRGGLANLLKCKPVTRGVNQGPVLGSPLFAIYTADIRILLSMYILPLQYSVVTNIYMQTKFNYMCYLTAAAYVSAASNELTNDLSSIVQWAAEHGLVLNTNTCVTIICVSQYQINVSLKLQLL